MVETLKGGVLKTLVLYCSKTGSNEYLAGRIAGELGSDIEKVIPRVGLFPVLMLSTLTGIGFGIRKLKSRIVNYEAVVLCGPLWLGRFAVPLQCVLRKYRTSIKRVYFATCCGSTDETRKDRFGYEGAFDHMEKLAKGRSMGRQAFPIALVVPKELQEDSKEIMNTKLSMENFRGPVMERLNSFADKIRNDLEVAERGH